MKGYKNPKIGHRKLQDIARHTVMKYGGHADNIVASSKNGVADVVGCLNGGRFIGIECKAGQDRVRRHQRVWAKRVVDANGYAIILNEKNIPIFHTFIMEASKTTEAIPIPKELVVPELDLISTSATAL